MRMKDDYMQNGQLKAGYNIQIATENQFTLAYDIFPNSTDTKTMKPFLDTIEESYFELPEHIVADTGYDSEANYEGAIYSQHKIDVKPVFGFLKANLGFSCFLSSWETQSKK